MLNNIVETMLNNIVGPTMLLAHDNNVIQALFREKNLQQLVRFLCVKKNYASISAPLTKLTNKEKVNTFDWTQECENAFRKLKNLVCTAPV